MVLNPSLVADNHEEMSGYKSSSERVNRDILLACTSCSMKTVNLLIRLVVTNF